MQKLIKIHPYKNTDTHTKRAHNQKDKSKQTHRLPYTHTYACPTACTNVHTHGKRQMFILSNPNALVHKHTFVHVDEHT